MNTHEHLIDRLGGTRAVADALGQNLSTVSMWRQRGVPWRFRPAVANLAKRQKVPLPKAFLEPGE